MSDYYRAVLHIEQCLAATHHAEALVSAAYLVLGSIDRPRSEAALRLRRLYNTSKHVDERIEAGELLDDATVPIWLTNEGMESKDHSLSFAELSAFMQDYVDLTNSILKQNQAGGST